MAVAAPKERRFIRIDGEVARITREVVEREVPVEGLMSELTRNKPCDTGMLPRGCVWYARHQDPKQATIQLYVVEIAPHMRKMMYRKQAENEKETANPDLCLKEYMVSWPNTLWSCRMRGQAVLDVYLTCTMEPLAVRKGDTRLFILPTPNQHDAGSGHFCLGSLSMDAKMPASEQIERMMEYLLSSVWNQDLKPRLDGVGITGIPDWAAKSAADPEFWRKIAYRPHGFGSFSGLLGVLNRTH